MKNAAIVFLSAIVLVACSSPEREPDSSRSPLLVLAKRVTAVSQECDPFVFLCWPDSDFVYPEERVNPKCRVAIDSTHVLKIVDMALNGKIKVYAQLGDTIPLTADAVKTRRKRHFQGFFIDRKTGKETPGEMDVDRLHDGYEMRFKEDWMLDPGNAEITKRILAYGIYFQKVDSRTGEFKGMESFFWVKNDNATTRLE